MADTKQDTKKSETTAPQVLLNKDTFNSLFERQINAPIGVKSITIGKTLTRPMLAMAHLKGVVLDCRSEMRTHRMPAQGRKGEYDEVRVIDGVALAGDEGKVQPGEEYTLVINETMAGAIERGGYTVLVRELKDGKPADWITKAGKSLIGRAFAFKSGAIADGKRYRTVDTVEVNIER